MVLPPLTTPAVFLCQSFLPFHLLILTRGVLSQHYTSAPNLNDVLSHVCYDRYHSGSTSNRLWWVRSIVSQILFTTIWCFQVEFESILKISFRPAKNLSQKSLFPSANGSETLDHHPQQCLDKRQNQQRHWGYGSPADHRSTGCYRGH